MKTSIFMSFITEFEESNLDKAVAFYGEVASEKRYLDTNLKLTQKRLAQNPKDSTKFAVVADYVSYEPDLDEQEPRGNFRKLPAPDKHS